MRCVRWILIFLTPWSALTANAEMRPEDQALLRGLAPFREKVAMVLSEDVSLRKSFQSYRQQGQLILKNPNLNRTAMMSQIKLLNAHQLPALNQLLAKAGVTRKDFLRKTGELFSEFERRNKQKYSWEVSQDLSIFWRKVSPEEEEVSHPRAETQIFELPLDDSQFFAVGPLRFVDLDTGVYRSDSSTLLIGSTSHENGIGMNFRSKRDFNRQLFKVNMPNVSVSLFVEGFLGGASASASTRLQVFKSTSDSGCERLRDHGSLLAVLFWYSSVNTADSLNFVCIQRTSGRPTDYIGRVITHTESTSVAGAAGSAFVDAHLSQFKIKHFFSE